MHEFRRGGEGEARSSTRAAVAWSLSLGMIRALLPRRIERDIAGRASEGRTDGGKKFESGR